MPQTIIFLAAYTVLLAWGIEQLGHRRFPLTYLLTVVVLYAAWIGLRGYHTGRLLVDDYKSLARTLAAYEQPTDAVILYTDTDWPIWAYHHPGYWYGVPHTWQITPEQAADYLKPIWETHDRVWLVTTPYAGVSDPQHYLSDWLAEQATAVTTTTFGDKSLHFFAGTSERAAQASQVLPATQPQYALSTTTAPGTQLIGYDQAAHDYRSGDTVHLALYWEANTLLGELEVGIIDNKKGMAQIAVITAVPATTPGLIRQSFTFNLPPDTPTGEYTFYIRTDQGENLHFGNLNLRQRFGAALLPADVTIAHPLEANFGDHVRLLGYDVEPFKPQAGGALYLTLYWQAQAPVSQSYKIFTHLLGETFNVDSGNFLWGQQDNEPVNQTRPTTTWRPGEVIVDRYAIPITANAPIGLYQIEIGLYEPATGIRLPLLGKDGVTAVADHLLLTPITINASSDP